MEQSLLFQCERSHDAACLIINFEVRAFAQKARGWDSVLPPALVRLKPTALRLRTLTYIPSLIPTWC